MKARLRRPERDPERCGDLRQGQVEIVVHHDERSRIRLETQEAALELVAIRDRRLGADDGGRVKDRQLDVDAMAPKPARLIDAGADEHPVEPGVEQDRIP